MTVHESTTRPQESSMLALCAELQELFQQLHNHNQEHQLMLIAKWEAPYFLVEISVFLIDSNNEDVHEETESDLNLSYLLADGEDLDNLFDMAFDFMPSLDQISQDSGFDLRAHTARAFEQMQDQVKGSMGLLRLGMDVNFTVGNIELSRWTAFAEENVQGSYSIVEEHKLYHSFERFEDNEDIQKTLIEGDDK